MNGLKRDVRVRNAPQGAERPFAKAAKATVLAAGLALAAATLPVAGCDLRPRPLASGGSQSECPPQADVSTKEPARIPVRGSGLMFGSTTLVDANGAPVAKVVLGDKSTPTDALAAALIVQKMAASTYKSLSLNASLGGSATCSAEPAGCRCSVDMDGVDPIIMPYNTGTAVVAVPYTEPLGHLLLLDKDAVGVFTIVSVGHEQGNTVTRDLLMGTAVDWNANPKIVKEIVQGSKIVVAGATPHDTLEAASDFIQQLKTE